MISKVMKLNEIGDEMHISKRWVWNGLLNKNIIYQQCGIKDKFTIKYC